MMDNLEPLRQASAQEATPTSKRGAVAGGLQRVDVRHADELSYEEFVHSYMARNRPVLIQVGMPA